MAPEGESGHVNKRQMIKVFLLCLACFITLTVMFQYLGFFKPIATEALVEPAVVTPISPELVPVEPSVKANVTSEEVGKEDVIKKIREDDNGADALKR
eukprot:CAMPEP_0167747212 /NCGR_PEP_ID=MMETSP0110_2-20121227/4156_1 /TAXON_ID=629695 /ORGANISM="Gymnochlora sp., Strain CCMP2014" /LENGTH=97 /DNA_ID=CAMNT_0007632089 /DNA_START=45 /DNA_END=341 /DNA_ORIENTATION=+